MTLGVPKFARSKSKDKEKLPMLVNCASDTFIGTSTVATPEVIETVDTVILGAFCAQLLSTNNKNDSNISNLFFITYELF